MNVPCSRLIRTTSFRLALAYAGVFAVSVAVLGSAVFYLARSNLDQQARNRVMADMGSLQAETGDRLDSLVTALNRRAGTVAALDYLLLDAQGRKLAGDLPTLALAPGWSTRSVPATAADNDGTETLRIYARRLPDGALLAIGEDLARVEETDEAILGTVGWALGATVLLGLAGGLVVSAAFLRRVDAISRTAEAIIDGDLRRRIPERGTDDDFDRLARTLNRMLDRIADLMDSLKQISSDIAHDMRQPLARLRQRVETVRAADRSVAAYEAALDAVIADADAIIATFSALLRIAQIESGSRRKGFRAVDLAKLAETVVEIFAPSAEDAGKTLALGGIEPAVIQGDADLLTQMLANLVENGMRHTLPGTRIEVAVSGTAGGPCLSVCDNGPGIPADEWTRITRRFYRLDRSRSSPGNGLGLALVAAIAELHDATLRFDDAAPGLRVEIRFPAPPPGHGPTAGDRPGHAVTPGTPGDGLVESGRPDHLSSTHV